MSIVQMNLGENSYSIHIQKGILDCVAEQIKTLYKGDRVAVVTDRNVDGLYGKALKDQLEESFEVLWIPLPPGESSKSIRHYGHVLEQLADHHIQRSDLVIAFGGGVIGDLTGFAAATYLRGIDYIQIPTTLLSQVDSSVGGKTAINLPQGKNLVGAFYQPKAVLIDPNTLSTLPKRELLSGLGEVIKYACIDAQEVRHILDQMSDLTDIHRYAEDLILHCCQSKQRFVEVDPLDKGKRMILNFGHTLGHGFEAESNYEMSHGKAVVMGMLAMAKLSKEQGWGQSQVVEHLEKWTGKFGYAIEEEAIPFKAIQTYLMNDKKVNQNKVNLIIVESMGQATIRPLAVDTFNQLLTGRRLP